MEGALPSVVGGLVSVPGHCRSTSVGYGASFGGVAALLGMLNSCASNVTVVNIDNGFRCGPRSQLDQPPLTLVVSLLQEPSFVLSVEGMRPACPAIISRPHRKRHAHAKNYFADWQPFSKTFITPARCANRIGLRSLTHWERARNYGAKSTFFLAHSLSAAANGPHREPITCNSFTTKPRSHRRRTLNVDFKISVPRASVIRCASANPPSDPVASTTNRKLSFARFKSESSPRTFFVAIPARRASASLLACLPYITRAAAPSVARGNQLRQFPSPSTATSRNALTEICCKTSQAAASGFCEHRHLIVHAIRYHVQIFQRQGQILANAPSCPIIPSTLRRAQCVSIRAGKNHTPAGTKRRAVNIDFSNTRRPAIFFARRRNPAHLRNIANKFVSRRSMKIAVPAQNLHIRITNSARRTLSTPTPDATSERLCNRD